MSIKDLEPKVVWGNFYGLTQVPRPSKHEEKVIEYLLKWGEDHGVEVHKDETGNIIFRAPATPGYENRRGVILQGHMDMVPQKTSDSTHNFLTDPIKAYVDGDWVTADRTTLGADNGMGVAMGLAVCEDKSVVHGPVEVLVTYDEETGMTGATALKPGVLKGDILINLDSEEEGELCVGCAGGLDVAAEFKYRKYPTKPGWKGLKLTVKGLQGGHSGMDISLYRANANKVMARILLPLMEVSVRPSIVWLMRMTPDGQARRLFTKFSITRPWMNFGAAGTSSTKSTAPGSLSLNSALISSKMLPMSFFTDSRFSAGTTVSTSASNGMALRSEPPLKLTTCTPNTSISGRRMRAITLFALARYKEMSMPE